MNVEYPEGQKERFEPTILVGYSTVESQMTKNRKYYKIDVDQGTGKGASDQDTDIRNLTEYDSIHLFGDERNYSIFRGELVIAFLMRFPDDDLLVDVFTSQKRRRKLLTELDKELDIIKTFGLLEYSGENVTALGNFLDKVNTWEYWLFSTFKSSQKPALMKIAKSSQLYDINSDKISEYTVLNIEINCDMGYFQVTCNELDLFDEFLMFQSEFFSKHRKVMK